MPPSSMHGSRWISAIRSARKRSHSALIPTAPSQPLSTSLSGNAEAGWIQLVDRVKQEVRLIADERRALPGARGCVPGRELGKPRIALVGLGLNEVGQEAQLWDKRLEHVRGLDVAVRRAESRETRRADQQRHDWVIAAVEVRIQRYPG